MTCESAQDMGGPYLDDELDPSLSAQMREHLAACPACAESQAQLQALRAGIRENAPYYRAPAELQDRIRTAVRQSHRETAVPWRWIALAAAILLAVSLFRPHTNASDEIAQSIFSSHLRSLVGAHLLDVPSSDQHTVKPWFNGKLDFSPDVRDFAAQGYPLIGGRIDYVGDRAVAALVFERRKHVINLFTWPSPNPDSATHLDRNGYHILHWNSDGMAWWAVSDLNVAELRQFESLYVKK